MPSETRESLTQKRGTTKRRITNLVKKIEQLVQKAEPSAIIFGWVLFGNVSSRQSTSEVTTLHASTSIPSCEETLQKFWTLEEPPKAKFFLSPLDKLVVQDFEAHHKREETGRFIVKLPLKPQRPTLGKSRPQALRRLLSLERRLQHDDQFSDYAKVINEYLTSGHAERVPGEDLN